jgi:GT2 family glycosyltransferase
MTSGPLPQPARSCVESRVSAIIPTLGRGEVVLQTIAQLRAQTAPPAEILIVDQTEDHPAHALQGLSEADRLGHIRWIRMSPPSQPAALNRGVLEARNELLLFLDDDIRIDPDFVAAHLKAHQQEGVDAVVGQVLQPGEVPLKGPIARQLDGPFADLEFPFRSAEPTFILNGMSGNLSVSRDLALRLGGFDERFTAPVSYRFDSDFCKRIVAAGGKVAFEPTARIDHLRAPRGGTRSRGSHMTSASPIHGVGDYYFALKQGLSWTTLRYILRRPVREVATKFHLTHPWWIPVKLFGELRAVVQAVWQAGQGPKYLSAESSIPAAPR